MSRLAFAVIEAGGGDLVLETGGVVVSFAEGGSAGATGVSGRSRSQQDGDVTVEDIGVVRAGPVTDGFQEPTRRLIQADADVGRTFVADIEAVRGIIDTGRLSVDATAVSQGVLVRGQRDEVELVETALTGGDWSAQAVHVVGDADAIGRILGDQHSVQVDDVGGRVVLRGYGDDVVSAIGTLRTLGLVGAGRAVDVAFAIGTREDLSGAGIRLGNSATEGQVVLSSGGSSEFTAVVSGLRTSGSVEIDEAPSISVRDGVPASLSVGRDVPVRVGTSRAEDGSAVEEFEFRQTGVVMQVETRAEAGGSVGVALSIEVSTVEGEGLGGNPVVGVRRFTTDVIVIPGRAYLVGTVASGRSVKGKVAGVGAIAGNREKSASELQIVLQVR